MSGAGGASGGTYAFGFAAPGLAAPGFGFTAPGLGLALPAGTAAPGMCPPGSAACAAVAAMRALMSARTGNWTAAFWAGAAGPAGGFAAAAVGFCSGGVGGTLGGLKLLAGCPLGPAGRLDGAFGGGCGCGSVWFAVELGTAPLGLGGAVGGL